MYEGKMIRDLLATVDRATLPSSADLDAVAAEDQARKATAKPAYRYVALIVRVPEPTGIVVTTFSTRIGNLVATALHCYEAPSVRGCEVIRSIEITEQKAKEIW